MNDQAAGDLLSIPFVVEKVAQPDFKITFDPKMTQEQINFVVQALSDFWIACGGSAPLRIEFKREPLAKKGDL